MQQLSAVNDFVVRFANVNGSGSASANLVFTKSIFRMGIPVSPKNIFPSNIQGLPTWYEVRISEQGYLGRRAGIDIMVCLNPQSIQKDVACVKPGGYFMYDSTKILHQEFIRDDIHYIGVPMMEMCLNHFSDPRQQQLLKNTIYVGALTALLDMEVETVKSVITEQFNGKEKIIQPNFKALEMGIQFIKDHYEYPLGLRVERRDKVGDSILMDGNAACGLGAVYAGATVAAWYPITPSTSLVNSYEEYAEKLRIDPITGKKKFAVVQMEDELAAIGVVIGAAWNGARSFTATSGPGVSLMNEFLGLAYFAEIPTVLVDVQRGGPSTGMPTRTQQSDILLAAYASHGDTKHVLLFPSNPKECFDMMSDAFDLAERLQTPVIVMTDLDLGMNENMSPALEWDDNRQYDRGKVLDAAGLESAAQWGRYLDVDGDGICYRTLPGTHANKGAYFTRGTSRDEFAKYTEEGDIYVRNMQRLQRKWETTKGMVPKPEIFKAAQSTKKALLYFGTSAHSTREALDILAQEGQYFDALRLRSFPFSTEVVDFIETHDEVYIIEQNRDAQLRTLVLAELGTSPDKLKSILNYDGAPITAATICEQIK